MKGLKFILTLVFAAQCFWAQSQQLWGMTSKGGSGNVGVIFSYDIESGIQKVFDVFGGVNGGEPWGNLTLHSNGKFYGLASEDGEFEQGVLFEFDPTDETLTVKFHFNLEFGIEPHGSVVETSNGKLYGIIGDWENSTSQAFEFDPQTQQINKVANFEAIEIVTTTEEFIKGENGKLYGLSNGLPHALFEFDPITYQLRRFSFSEYTGHLIGPPPLAASKPLRATNGKMYMITNGAEGYLYLASIVECTTELNCTRKFDINSPFEYLPPNLIEASNGKFYGLDADSQSGYVTEYDPHTNSLLEKLTFDHFFLGESAVPILIRASDGKIYGMSERGGENDLGTLFQYDVEKNEIKKLIDLDGTNGSSPVGGLVEIPGLITKVNESVGEELQLYPNPVNDKLMLAGLKNADEIWVSDVTGKAKVFASEKVFNGYSIDTSLLAPGIYILNVRERTREHNLKFIKK